ncbi:hypothetical protein MMC13_007071 [Lambiella insularis]|nr:hypothetical protein [Lambiella insularis]
MASINAIKTMRVHVHLCNGMRMIVPINVEVTVAQLIAETTRRVVAMNIPQNNHNNVLRLDDGSILFAEDKLADLLDLTQDHTFFLGPMEESLKMPMISSREQSTSTDDSWIYVRWITAGRALDHTTLDSIPPDGAPLHSSTTIRELRELAFNRLHFGAASAEDEPPASATAELFLTSCYLSPLAHESLKLHDLQLKGSLGDPLDVFIVLVDKSLGNPKQDGSDKADRAWSFASTDHGKATFQTCLMIFLKEILDQKLNLENALNMLWDITHFPPALLALRQLYQDGLYRLRPLPLAVFASSFREVSLRIVPTWISSSPDSVLESSRQVFSWLHSFQTISSKPSVSKCQLVHKVELKEMNVAKEEAGVDQSGRLEHTAYTHVRITNTATDTKLSSGEVYHQKISVSKEKEDSVKVELLAAALWGFYQSPYNFYFDYPISAVSLRNHCRADLLHPQDFDNLLQTTRQVEAFRLIGPLQLGACASSTLPVLTLDSEGYISRYDQQDRECSEREFYTSNVFRKEVLSGSDPGQYLLQKLRPIIETRKKEGTWEIDAWDQDCKTMDTRTPEEAIVICVDQSGSMGTAMRPDWISGSPGRASTARQSKVDELSRLSEVKVVFSNLVSRISAYRLPTHLGLVTFSGRDSIKIDQNLTPVLYDFQDRLNDAVCMTNTAIFDAIKKASEKLASFKKLNPQAKLRIVLLTDGDDNASQTTPAAVCKRLYDLDIVLDAIVIGTTKTIDLFKIATHTGGYAFNPISRELLFQIFLLDGCIDIKTRPDIQKLPIVDYSLSMPKHRDMPTKYIFPPSRSHPRENDNFISLSLANGHFANMSRRFKKLTTGTPSTVSSSVISSEATTWTSGATAVAGPGGQSRQYLNELMAMIGNPHPSMDVYVSESDIGFWKVVMEGPPGSAYEDGTFVLYVDLGEHFPLHAPTVRFITPVLHPNITKHGRICHEIFNREWHSGIRVYEVLQHVWSIFLSLEARDAVDPLFTLRFWTDPEGGKREVTEYIRRFALKTRGLHGIEILGHSSTKSYSTSSPSESNSWNSSIGAYTPSKTPSIASNTSEATLISLPVNTPSASSTAGSDIANGDPPGGRRSRSFFRRVGTKRF